MSSCGGIASVDHSSPVHPVIYELEPVKNTLVFFIIFWI
ncbi:hypothetical protein RBEAN4_1536 [Rickettsia bellii str. RML An4]|uniref:Uncharacterized protein n=1 Tax=Rickettsia bellii str. RML An4 TaxID=1359193 RepID=A0A0F3QD54_RICBE|nr:hypothetical protein RBEAN4_1536 [Rickettsia bellii str. RML An4]